MGTWVPVQVNYTLYQGADFSDCIALKDPDSITDPPAPLPLPWSKGRLELREDYGTTPIITLTDVVDDDDSGLVFDHDGGKITINVDARTTEELRLNGEPLVLLYDLVCFDTDTNPRVDRVAQGYFIIWPECSRAAAP